MVERHLTQFVRVLPYEMLVFLMNFIFSRRNKKTSCGKKHTALFQTHNSEKSSFFSAGSYVYFHGYIQIRDRGGTMCPLPVLIGLVSAFTFKLSSFLRLLIVLVLSPCQTHASPQNLNCNRKPKTLVKI